MAEIARVIEENVQRGGQEGRIVELTDGRKVFLVGRETSDFNRQGLRDLLEQQGQLQFSPFLEQFATELGASTPDPESFQLPEFAGFEEQAAGEIGLFFDKDLELALRQINTAKEQARELKGLAEEFQERQEEQFFRVEDKNFANALDKAQGRFAGAGTADSGFRVEQLAKERGQREEGLEEARTGFEETTRTRTLGFEQFIRRREEQEERVRLQSGRGRDVALLETQRELQREEQIRRQSEIAGFRNLLQQQLAA